MASARVMTLPLVMPPAVTAMMFLLMLNGSFGVLAHGLFALGINGPLAAADPRQWQCDPRGHDPGRDGEDPARRHDGRDPGGVWQWTPFMVLIMLAGLRSLPKEPFEAAAIDGANAFRCSAALTLPMMSRVIASRC